MKKLLTTASVVCALCASMAAAHAQEEKQISINVDNRSVRYTDQVPVIEDDRVLVPLRDVFNAMGADVEWNGEERSITVSAKDNRTRLIFKVDDVNFKKLNFVTLFETKAEDLTCDVAPKIINDRTMLPLRVVSENFDADVNWDADTYTVTIASKQLKAALGVEKYDDAAYAAYNEKVPNIALSADKDTVSAGETVTLSVDLTKVSGFESLEFSGAAVTINYDPEIFEYTSSKAIGETETEEPYAFSDNPTYKENAAKIVYVLDPTISHTVKDRKLIEVTFTAKKDGAAEFSIANTFTAGSHDNFISLFNDKKIEVLATADALYLDTNAVKVTVGAPAEQEENTQATDEAVIDDEADKTTDENAELTEEATDEASADDELTEETTDEASADENASEESDEK